MHLKTYLFIFACVSRALKTETYELLVTNLAQVAPEGSGILNVELGWTSLLNWTSFLVFSASTPLSKYSMNLLDVSKNENIIR